VTFREVRDHIGVEAQRQWSDRAIARTTPCLLALFSMVALLAARLNPQARKRSQPPPGIASSTPPLPIPLPPFWQKQGLFTSHSTAEEQKSQPVLHEAIAYALCYAA
jgi:hypothetical protein